MKENSAVYNSELTSTGIRKGNNIVPRGMSKDYKPYMVPPLPIDINDFPKVKHEFPKTKSEPNKKRKIMYFEEFSKR
jgi:hypothetical protein